MAGHTKAPSELICDFLTRPALTRITNPNPVFGWVVHAQRQSAYRILVGSSEKELERGDMWDSQKQPSAQSQNVPYEGAPLQSNATYFWKVCSWDERGESNGFSEPQMFHTGDFSVERRWPGESRWIQVEGAPGIGWAPEDRNPLVFREVAPSKVVSTGEGCFIDFGKAAFAYVELAIDNASPAPAELTLTIQFGEKAEGAVIDANPGACVVYTEIPLKISPGSRVYHVEFPRYVSRYPYSQVLPEIIHEVAPFRYCAFSYEGLDIRLVNARMFALHTMVDFEASRFHSNDPTLNAVYELCKYSTIANTFNGDYAASQRERMLYEADCYIHQLSHYSVDREFSLARYSFKNMVFHPTWPTEWSPHVVMMAWKDYMYTGDDRALKFYYDDLKPKTLSALKCDNGLISTRTGLQTEEFLRSLHFKKKKPGTVENYPEHLVDIVDWPHEKGSTIPGGETDNYEFTDYNTVVNAFHYPALITMGHIAEACGHEADARAYKKEAEEFSKVFNDLLLISGQGVYRDGVGSEHSSLHANLYPLAFGLVPAEHLESVLAHIKKKGMACGVYSANYLLEALFDHGEDECAHRLMVDDGERSWVNMMRIGSTMTIEAWDNKFKKNNGWSHAWSASPAHIIPRKLMGVEPLTPGFEKIRIQPRLGMLREADLKIPTIRGDLEMKAKQNDKHFEVSLNLPGNTRTMLVIPLHGKKTALRNLEKDYPSAVIQGDRLIIDDLPPGPHTVRLLFE